MSDAAKSLDILATSLSFLHYFDGLTKLFSNLYLAKFLHTLAKVLSTFFSCFFSLIFMDTANVKLRNQYSNHVSSCISYYIELDFTTFDLLVTLDNIELIFREFKSARAGTSG